MTVFETGSHETWSNAMFVQRLLKIFGDGLVNDPIIYKLNQTTETTNELLSAIHQRDSPETGYEKLHLIDFEGLLTPLEESVMERIKDKLAHVQDFKVAEMTSLPSEVRSQLVDFAADVIEQHQSKITHFNFKELIRGKEVASSDTRLADVLCNSGQTELETLNLEYNSSWFKDPTIKASLFAFIKSQTSLVKLDLSDNSFSANDTTDLLCFLCQSSNVATLEDLNLEKAADFSSD